MQPRNTHTHALLETKNVDKHLSIVTHEIIQMAILQTNALFTTHSFTLEENISFYYSNFCMPKMCARCFWTTNNIVDDLCHWYVKYHNTHQICQTLNYVFTYFRNHHVFSPQIIEDYLQNYNKNGNTNELTHSKMRLICMYSKKNTIVCLPNK